MGNRAPGSKQSLHPTRHTLLATQLLAPPGHCSLTLGKASYTLSTTLQLQGTLDTVQQEGSPDDGSM